MARTVQQVLDRAWEILQDDGTRYPEAELCAHVVDAVQQVRSVRPDIFVGAYAAALPDTLTVAQALPIPDQFFASVSQYVAGMAELRDDEFAIDGRAMMMKETLTKKLVSGM